MARSRRPRPADIEKQRLQNRECMRKARQRQRQGLREMQVALSALEKQYKELSHRSANKAKTTNVSLPKTRQDRMYAEVVAVAKRLGAENLYLQSMLKQMNAWELQLQ
ncbi:hypothetical protein GN244_ATG10142 [Phytophthora infestans]|uniref:BZIP domain-containing protein n=1 Tax=Phytophthora infestans TaxID=4787 RepID=A0A833WD04_PHYIN|nr:hypothetical protein GN244_ATG10142 [Phytophthora infestans]